MLRDRVAPELRAVGLSGSGQVFRLKSTSHHVILSFQRSRLAPPGEVHFTANLAIFDRDTWNSARDRDPVLPEQPEPTIFYPTVDGIQTRIGHLAGGSTDIWWKIGELGDAESVAAEVVRAIRSFMIPVIQSAIADKKAPDDIH
ncbi:DUF4304 domain-containing protein [Pseudofrankia sp. DC12]|uniref:DUF4304 domain-containing protein n=1 Tax=Pseudofrankia sp. DC12 TaxID=683315 RepID=UPI000A01D40B|nr:DUF4304 domain-containing protein [Pseudofrankia sp. DC12]